MNHNNMCHASGEVNTNAAGAVPDCIAHARAERFYGTKVEQATTVSSGQAVQRPRSRREGVAAGAVRTGPHIPVGAINCRIT